MGTLLSLATKLVADVDSYNRDIEKADTITGKLTTSLGNMAKIAAGVVVAGITAVTGALTSGVVAAAEWGGSVDDLSDITGQTAREASGFSVLLKTVGVDAETGGKMIAFLGKGLFDAKGELGTTGTELKKLGIGLYDTNGRLKTSNALFQEASDKITAMPDGIEKTTAMMDLFGKSGKDASDLLGAAANGGMEEYNKQAERLGLSLSPEQVANAEAFGRVWETVQMVFQGLAVTVGNYLIPVILPLLKLFTDLGEQVIGFIKGTSSWGDVKGAAQKLWDGISGTLTEWWLIFKPLVVGYFTGLWTDILNYFYSIDWAGVWQYIETTFVTWWTPFKPKAIAWFTDLWQKVVDAVNSIPWDTVTEWVNTGTIFILTKFQEWINSPATHDAFFQMGAQMGTSMVDGLTGIFSGKGSTFTSLFTAIDGFFMNLNAVTTIAAIEWAAELVSGFITAICLKLGQGTEAAARTKTAIYDLVRGGLILALGMLDPALKNFVWEVVAAIVRYIGLQGTTLYNALAGWINQALARLGIQGLSLYGSSTDNNTPSNRAAGGPASGLTWVGENGRELLDLPTGSYVTNHYQSENMLSTKNLEDKIDELINITKENNSAVDYGKLAMLSRDALLTSGLAQ